MKQFSPKNSIAILKGIRKDIDKLITQFEYYKETSKNRCSKCLSMHLRHRIDGSYFCVSCGNVINPKTNEQEQTKEKKE